MRRRHLAVKGLDADRVLEEAILLLLHQRNVGVADGHLYALVQPSPGKVQRLLREENVAAKPLEGARLCELQVLLLAQALERLVEELDLARVHRGVDDMNRR